MKQTYTLLLLFAVTFIQAQIVNIPDANLKNALVNDIVADFDGDGASDGDVDTNNDGEIQESEAELVLGLNVSSKNIFDLNGIQEFINLEVLNCSSNSFYNLNLNSNLNLKKLTCVNSNNLSSINVSNNLNIEELKCSNGNINNLIIGQKNSLRRIECEANNLVSFDISQLPNLNVLQCGAQQLNNLDVSNNIELIELGCGMTSLSSLDVTQNINLEVLDMSMCQFSNIDLTQNTNLKELYFDNTSISNIDLSMNINLESIQCNYTQLSNLDLSQSVNLQSLSCNNSQLVLLNIKNGSIISDSNNLNFSNNPNLLFICSDYDEVPMLDSKLGVYGYTNCEVNSYCTFLPGGKYYLVEGESKLDLNADGCDIVGPFFPNIMFEIADGINYGYYLANYSGNFSFPVFSGITTITPQLENPTYYSVTPTNLVVDFPTSVSPYNQDFCVTPNGVYNDLEISILPLNQARPGFNAHYKLVYKNKGTNTLSGNVELSFNDDLMDFVTATPAETNQTSGVLSWNYTNIEPFETRTIDFTMNINTPTDSTNPVNEGDVLNYVATVNPVAGDETPEDNVATLNQTVVNSYDPNDKTCIEGATIEPSMVGEYLHYLIRFENTGSASAVNIVVKDIIDTSKYDINSLRPIDGSHSFVTRIRNTNIVEFIFENINLPHDDANNDGYVAFKIKSKSSLVLGDTLDNNAEIYFDYNSPIITNVAQTTVAVLGIGDYILDSSLKMYPNPVKDNLIVSGNNNLKSITIYDVNGRLLQEVSFIGNQLERTISLSELETGMYVVKIVSSKGQLVKQIMKE
ncbi:T9SS type A sorting domain-containing protein [Pseudofulvibacter geojedonensis]|uniref:T9SS type A sorting domain-containing protein n=1 Tax=Pseudofulvibacter geojedonensis TaxID=1123758 RepID=A0ABW3HZQ6_9FLAO